MFVISKKRLSLILGLIMISIVTVLVINQDIENKTIETVALPVTNKVIVIDARTRNSR